MTGSKRADHWTSGTVDECSEIAGSYHKIQYNRTGRTDHPERDRQNGTGRTGQAEWDRQYGTGKKG
jgi:hypothetical protein